MSERCKHLKCDLTYDLKASMTASIMDGNVIAVSADTASPTGGVSVNCDDCGRTFRFGASAIPEWVGRLIGQVALHEDGGATRDLQDLLGREVALYLSHGARAYPTTQP